MTREHTLKAAVDHLRHLVPAQSPLDRFVHHNPLHAFEDLKFEDGVLEAAALYNNEPYWSEEAYRAELAKGRIQHRDLQWVVQREVLPHHVAGIVDRRVLAHALLAHPFEALGGEALEWTLSETDVLLRPRADLRPKTYNLLVAEAGGDPQRAVQRLWEACVSRRAALPLPSASGEAGVQRVRDVLLGLQGSDLDSLVHPVLIRWAGAFLDHGVSYWPMSDRNLGFFEAFLLHYDQPFDVGRPWLQTLRDEVRRARRDGLSASAVSLEMLDALGHPEAHWAEVLERTVMALPGWTGMFQRLADRPDTAPERLDAPTDMAEFIAVRLMLEVSAANWLLGDRPGKSLLQRARLLPDASAATPDVDPAWTLFQVCQMLGISASVLADLTDAAVSELLVETYALDPVRRRMMLHTAYERRFRVETLDAVSAHARRMATAPHTPVRVQCTFCVDDREESTRRLLEEVAPWIETLGGPGSYGISMYFQGLDHGHPQALGPAGFEPRHIVVERSLSPQPATRRWQGLAQHNLEVGSQTLFRGGLVSLGGVGAALPMALRILAPRLHGRLTQRPQPEVTELDYFREGEERDAHGYLRGFSLEEQVDIAEGSLRIMSLVKDFAPLVCCFGHGSRSMNNPHEAAHDCGACGGGRGGPNARVFARFLNDPRVKAGLRERGIDVPEDTWFVGAYHNTADDAVEWFDLQLVPESHRALLAETRVAIDQMRALDAHERCRKFESVPLHLTPEQALHSVENRVEDLAQPRPEYGHCTDAMCFVGRRSWSRGLFLDRRAFLCSYDPECDDDGSVLATLLSWALPVGAGINLEYWFSVIDNEGYGSGTKLPHNITGLVGVMNGHQSDLRTGLPWQMVEVHEPVRLLCVVEATPEALLKVATDHPDVGRLVVNGWIQLASLDARTGELMFFEDGGFVPWRPEVSKIPLVRSSREWYAGTRGLLPAASVVPAGGAR